MTPAKNSTIYFPYGIIGMFLKISPDSKFNIFVLAGLIGFCAALPAQEVSSPDGNLVVEIALSKGTLTYGVKYKGRAFLEPSPLGLETSIGSFSTALKAAGARTCSISENYTLPHGKTSSVQYRANELVTSFSNGNGDRIDVIFRVSDCDVALAYRISSSDKRRIKIEREHTGFNLPNSAKAFVSPQVRWGGGYMGTKPSYEEGYMMDVSVDTKSWTGMGFTFPALFRLEANGWILLSETGVTSAYAGTHLSNPTSEGIYTIEFPDMAENAGIGDATVSGALPLLTSWKTITIGETLAPIVETTVATDVVKPLYEPSQYYQPGRSTWSWILWQDPSMNEQDQRIFIDLSSKLGFEYVLIDALWDERIGREKMTELVAYADSKGVGVMLWYNSNGYWNDAPQSPRNYMHTAPARRKEMAWLRSIGVKGLKIDFFGGDKQTTMKLYEDILTDANTYGLMLNFHGATLPRGWERIYPNHMTSEAVTASENLIFSQSFADQEAFNSTVFPFVRNPVAAMDYGPVFLSKRFSKDPNRGNVRLTTDAFQLATAVLYFSPIQHFGLTPRVLEEQPSYVIDFLKNVPTVWDETRFIDGYPGEFAVIARRSGDRWYIAATHAGSEKREVVIRLPWLKNQQIDLFFDKSDQSVGLTKVKLDETGSILLNLEPFGGAVLIIAI